MNTDIKPYFETPIKKIGNVYWRLTVTDNPLGGRVLNYEFRYHNRDTWRTLTTQVRDAYFGQASSAIKIYGAELKKLYAANVAEITASMGFEISDRVKAEFCKQENLLSNQGEANYD